MASDPTAGGAPADMPVETLRPQPRHSAQAGRRAWKCSNCRPRRPSCRTSFCARSPRRRTCAAAPSRTSRRERKFGIERFARDMLSVADNLGRALSALPDDADAIDPALSNVIVGVQATERELQSVLERHGITRIESLGKPFNAEFHQAMMEVEDPTVAAGTVVQELAPGYLIAGRLLRAAMVAVSKGGPTVRPAQQRELGACGPAGRRTGPGGGKPWVAAEFRIFRASDPLQAAHRTYIAPVLTRFFRQVTSFTGVGPAPLGPSRPAQGRERQSWRKSLVSTWARPIRASRSWKAATPRSSRIPRARGRPRPWSPSPTTASAWSARPPSARPSPTR